MGQYKGALNPQAHGQNSFESERTFHGGDNVVIETFADGLLSSGVSTKFIIKILALFDAHPSQ